VRHRVRSRVAGHPAGHGVRRRHSHRHARQRLLGGGAMSDRPTVILGPDMPADLAANVSTALQEMGVAVQTNGHTAASGAGRVIVVLSPKGGSGKTAIASNLAVVLAERHPGRVVAVDL